MTIKSKKTGQQIGSRFDIESGALGQRALPKSNA
jgi:hypothetical protein